MAKKKTKSTPQKTAKKKSKKESMVSKVEIKQPIDQEKVSKIVGMVFIFLGIVLVSYGIYSFVRFSRNPELDDTLDSPNLSGTEQLTNGEEVLIKGFAEEYDEVFIYVDSEEVGRVDVGQEGEYEYSYPVDSEGKYAVSVAGVRGFPKRFMSVQSDVYLVEVDWTGPELISVDYPVEVGTETFTLVGQAEALSQVTVKRGTDKYVVECDENGEFSVEGILLEEGPNVFTLEIEDEAGNMVEAEEKVRITYSQDSSVNGNAVTDELPVASGELQSAMQMIRENNIMVIFGLMAILSFMVSSGFVLVKYKGRE